MYWLICLSQRLRLPPPTALSSMPKRLNFGKAQELADTLLHGGVHLTPLFPALKQPGEVETDEMTRPFFHQEATTDMGSPTSSQRARSLSSVLTALFSFLPLYNSHWFYFHFSSLQEGQSVQSQRSHWTVPNISSST